MAVYKLNENNDLLGRPPHKKDDIFYTLNKSIPDVVTSVRSAVTNGMVSAVEKILSELQIEDKIEAGDILFSDEEFKDLREQLVNHVIEKIGDQVEKVKGGK